MVLGDMLPTRLAVPENSAYWETIENGTSPILITEI
ncbi:MAG: hypothetical protein CM15mP71_2270 [Candidatus Poseidoniales archaeon]|nr:MAG: hypothetical protein CM15mP71_2270 [Candidatus Poseidoniales archaeon]